MNQEPAVAGTIFSAGIIAAGDGTRLQAAYPGVLKPLVPVAGRPLIDWTASSLISAGAREILVLLNSKGRGVREHLRSRFPKNRWIFLEADTRSSWESFRIVSETLAERTNRFLISTVDALIAPADVARFAAQADGAALALTEFVEDEKPLWTDIDAQGRISAMGPDARDKKLVTCGLYALTRELVRSFQPGADFSSLRDFWITTVRSGIPVRGEKFTKTVDVDRPEDIITAEEFVGALGTRA